MLDPFDPDSFIVTADVHIVGIEPWITRTLELPVKLNFAQFHEVLQAAFGWSDSHLHRFDVGGLTIGATEFDDGDTYGPRTFEASEVRMQDLSFPYSEDSQAAVFQRSRSVVTPALTVSNWIKSVRSSASRADAAKCAS